tara:strand:+ start:247 stop:411 length:165 start_codon:yes stop_codon:yes gene_type:complete
MINIRCAFTIALPLSYTRTSTVEDSSRTVTNTTLISLAYTAVAIIANTISVFIS